MRSQNYNTECILNVLKKIIARYHDYHNDFSINDINCCKGTGSFDVLAGYVKNGNIRVNVLVGIAVLKYVYLYFS